MSPVLTPCPSLPAAHRTLARAQVNDEPREAAEATLRDLAFILLLAERIKAEIAAGRSTGPAC
jgi:hypothetical protein